MTITTPAWARDVTRVAVLTGAGISTASGIPDYRGPDGVWTRDPGAAEAFTYDRFLADASVRARFWRTYHGHPAWDARPNAAHEALARLDRAGIAVRVLTQNIDGLHQLAGLAPRKVLELHGTMRTTRCVGCRARTPTEEVAARATATEPRCPTCGGILKLDTILFGENLDGQVLAQAASIAKASPLFLAVGSSLLVEPAASLCRVAVEHGARLVIVNRDATPYDDLATEVIRADVTEVVPTIVGWLTTP
ncbi:Sir2 family NAD-dependent protein deacetylase [Luedemannella flava]